MQIFKYFRVEVLLKQVFVCLLLSVNSNLTDICAHKIYYTLQACASSLQCEKVNSFNVFGTFCTVSNKNIDMVEVPKI